MKPDSSERSFRSPAPPSPAAGRIVATYAFFSCTWIIVSDLAVNASVSHNPLDLLLSVSKGLLFVLVTSLLLLVLMRRSEARLRASEEHFRSLFEFAPVAYMSLDEQGRLVDVNQAWLTHMGHGDGPEAGPRRLEERVAPHDLGRFRDCLAELLAGATIRGREFDLVRSDGETFRASFDAHATPDGGRMHCIIVDVTERRRAEDALRRTEEQLRQSQKMEAVGQLAGGVAHDFNNLLLVMLGHTQMLMHGKADAEGTRRGLEMIQRAGDRAASLTRQLLAFSRRQVLQPTVVDLNAVIVESTRMLRRLVREDVSLHTVLDPALPPVFADSGQVEQVVMNLVVNARDAMPGGGALTVETSSLVLGEALCQGSSEMRPGRYVVLTVRDTGCGMDEQTRSRMFEPFFTTKDVGQGSGLGLSMVYGIVRQSGGFIHCESRPGHGSTFRIYLPEHAREKAAIVPARPEPVPEPVPEPASHAAGGGETVLLVEDDAAVRSLVRDILVESGYAVIVAEGGGQALAALESREGAVHLLLADVVMPEQSGYDLACQLRLRYPELRVILMSGYTDHPGAEGGTLGPPGSVFLQKPFGPDALVTVVRRVLDAPTHAPAGGG